MKQVWILNHYAVEPGAPGGTRHYSLSEHLPRFGWKATIIAASAEHNGDGQRLQANEAFRHEVCGKVPFLWLRTPRYRGNGGGRMVNMLAYTMRALLPASTAALPRPDAIIGSSVHPFAALAGALLARRHGVPFLFEVRDLWPQTLIDLGRLTERHPMTWMLRRLERALYRSAENIVTVLPNAADYIAPLGIPRSKVTWIPNGVETDAFPLAAKPQPAPGAPFVLMYLGSHGTANGLDHVLHALLHASRQLPPGALQLRMVGDGPLKPELRELARRLGLDNVSFEPPVAKTAIPALAAQADAFVISVLDRPQLYRYGISMNKLFDYLAAARPILIASAAANNPVADANAGIAVPPADPAALGDAIVKLWNLGDAERRRMGLAGRHYVETHHRFQMLSRRLAETLDRCVDPVAQPRPELAPLTKG
ncbi:glycosyltransferase family 4 protein [Noviherbaspirillum galbum]|uniref:Glycosyltransferase family 4 protein n=1 Tax=Noviherbaspirillum galbum TaxID=2709383 RepID=A0A6B3STU1_9BURK|nr:glycosyltransferase family 4 protein [Noviherbaspirillum galbum]NEX64021.1 glycosyltransferase family 4 protein [Noviherbaspirillum galbum]